MRRFAPVLVVALFAALALTACGDDSGSDSSDAARYCELEDEFDAVPEPDTDDEIDEFWSELQRLATEAAAVAPDEIREDVVLVADAVNGITSEDFSAAVESGDDPLGAPELIEANERIGAWWAENCTDE
jgi:hypothetical protein